MAVPPTRTINKRMTITRRRSSRLALQPIDLIAQLLVLFTQSTILRGQLFHQVEQSDNRLPGTFDVLNRVQIKIKQAVSDSCRCSSPNQDSPNSFVCLVSTVLKIEALCYLQRVLLDLAFPAHIVNWLAFVKPDDPLSGLPRIIEKLRQERDHRQLAYRLQHQLPQVLRELEAQWPAD